jgi:hypothetical protein
MEQMNAIQLKAFNQCRDSEVESSGLKNYCIKYIQPDIDFWDMDVSYIFFLNLQNNTCEDLNYAGLEKTCQGLINPVFS